MLVRRFLDPLSHFRIAVPATENHTRTICDFFKHNALPTDSLDLGQIPNGLCQVCDNPLVRQALRYPFLLYLIILGQQAIDGEQSRNQKRAEEPLFQEFGYDIEAQAHELPLTIAQSEEATPSP